MAGSSAQSLPRPLDAVQARAWWPGRSDTWWCVGIPFAIIAGVLITHAFFIEFYQAYVLPEGYGFLEFTQFFLAASASVLCFQALGYNVMKGSRLLRILVLLFGLAAFYIAGEEHSWGQHFFNWGTPDYWAEINRQQETNLHNLSPWFNQRPKLVFDFAMFVGGLLVPLVQLWTGPFRSPLVALLTPSLAIAPAAVIALVFKAIDDLNKSGLFAEAIFTRPSEVVETFQYLYMLFYVVMLRRRLAALDETGVRKVPL